MASRRRQRNGVLRNLQAALVAVFGIMLIATQAAQAQTYKVIYNFTGGAGGTGPQAGVTMDARGNLYGTTFEGGSAGKGLVYKLTNKNPNWVFTPLYDFAGGNDGAIPQSGVVFGPNGTLYGTTTYGGMGCGSLGCGTVFDLRPPATACKTAICYWTETVIHRFTDDPDGATPASGNVIFDGAGSLYGATTFGGTGNNCTGNSCGTVYKLTPSGNDWTECVIYSFKGPDGVYPNGVIFDNAGQLLYGTTEFGTNGDGAVFELTPSGCHATEGTIYVFDDETHGGFPFGGLIFDLSGSLYGTTSDAGVNHGGTVFELIPHWTYKLLYSLTGSPNYQFQGPTGSLARDSAGNLYGTTLEEGAHLQGTIFRLSPQSDGSWTYTDLHDFPDFKGDGSTPYGNVILDANGNLYGTALSGGMNGAGVVWEITP